MGQLWPNNTTEQISPADARDVVGDILDSYALLDEVPGVIPEYNRYVAVSPTTTFDSSDFLSSSSTERIQIPTWDVGNRYFAIGLGRILTDAYPVGGVRDDSAELFTQQGTVVVNSETLRIYIFQYQLLPVMKQSTWVIR